MIGNGLVSGTFIQGGAGKILLVCHEPTLDTDRVVVALPPLMEEMNKSRRLIWQLGHLLSAQGIMMIVPDLFGTGDSEGSFSEAQWNTWLQDIQCTIDWTRDRGVKHMSALVVRTGSLLFSDVCTHSTTKFEKIIMWEPVSSGTAVIRQLLRMKKMALRMAGESSESAAGKPDNVENRPLEVAGYAMSSDLTSSIESASFSESCCEPLLDGLIIHLDQRQKLPENETSDCHSEATGSWKHQLLEGEKFWLAVEPGPNPQLIEETLAFFAQS